MQVVPGVYPANQVRIQKQKHKGKHMKVECSIFKRKKEPYSIKFICIGGVLAICIFGRCLFSFVKCISYIEDIS